MAQLPRITYSELGKCWYVVTRYKERQGIDPVTGEKHNYIVAERKFNVTEQMKKILETHDRNGLRLKKEPDNFGGGQKTF